MYHILFFNVVLEKRGEVTRLVKTVKEAVSKFKGIELVGLFFPRGSGYMYAMIVKYKDYATWEKLWMSPKFKPLREKGNAMVTEQMDMFLDEMTYAYPELHG